MTRQQEVEGTSATEEMHETLRPASRRKGADVDFGQPELRGGGGDPDIAGQRQDGAAAKRVSIAGRDHREPGRLDLVIQGVLLALSFEEPVPIPFELLDIRAHGKGLPGPGEHHAPNGRISLEHRQRLPHRPFHRKSQDAEGLRGDGQKRHAGPRPRYLDRAGLDVFVDRTLPRSVRHRRDPADGVPAPASMRSSLADLGWGDRAARSIDRPMRSGLNSLGSISFRGVLTFGRKSIWAKTSRSRSMPGAASTSSSPSCARRNTARSVTYRTVCPFCWPYPAL